jgi:prepilin-type N-terminal cleavage/methylation domain-containing protein
MKQTKGFSLIELLVALVLALVFGIAMTKLLNNTTHQASTIKDVSDVSKTSRISLFIMARDIANAGYMLNCVGKECGAILVAPTSEAIDSTGTTGCYFSGITAPGCPAVPNYSAATSTLTINYAALTDTDPIQTKYSIANSSLCRQIVLANTTSSAAPECVYVANNIVAMAFSFGSDSTGAVAAGTGTATYSSTMTDITQLRSIKIALLTRSALPDKKFDDTTAITWLGGSYAIPTGQSHYRFKVIQQEVFLLNPTTTVDS